MIVPDITLAKALTAVVMDTIERQGTISSAGLEETILGKLLFMDAMAALTTAMVADNGNDMLAKSASRLLDELGNHPQPVAGWSHALSRAFLDLRTLLERLGKR